MRQYLDELKAILDKIQPAEVTEVCNILYQTYCDGNTVFVFGNGGSASMASHIVGDWAKETVPLENKKPFKKQPRGDEASDASLPPGANPT